MSKEDIKELKALIKAVADNQKEILEKFDDFKVEIRNSISAIGAKTEQLSLKVKRIEYKVEQFADEEARTRNLILNGIPAKEGEDLAKIFKSLVANLGYEAEPEAKYFRGEIKFFKGESDKRPILLKFPTEFHKEDFMQRYFKVASSLVLAKIVGFSKELKSRIYLQHDFSPEQYKINKSAIKLRASGGVKAIRITHGNVGIKFADDGPLIYFNSVGAFEREAKKKKNKQNDEPQ